VDTPAQDSHDPPDLRQPRDNETFKSEDRLIDGHRVALSDVEREERVKGGSPFTGWNPKQPIKTFSFLLKANPSE
jgi:hypothetical protein